MMIPQKVVLLFSGGLDSTVLLEQVRKEGALVHCLTLDYGQSHEIEIQMARNYCLSHGIDYTVLPIHGVFRPQSSTLLRGSSTGTKIVQGRNLAFLSIAISLAMQIEAQSVLIGCNADDVRDFPDCSPAFIASVQQASLLANGPEVAAPFSALTKREIVKIGRELGVDFEKTWSCYHPHRGEACGKCDACRLRGDALA